MGISNRTAALERKISLLLGGQHKKAEEIDKAERLYAQVPDLRRRVTRINDLIFYCKEIIKDDQPDWTPENVKALRPFVHKIPIKLGSAVKIALDVLRTADAPMTIREIAVEVLRREGQESVDKIMISKVADAIGNNLRKRKRPYLANDGEWPSRWWVVKTE